ncbi:clathrin assembly sigma-adaptin protein complex 4 [Trypanosoma cruzi]|uniref:AP complex subunit sigma n=1 Tax=Trypanosoma cruzi TaxID=5693 RepID=A0A2V2W4H0_TRYCR|nr:clathrin assembly sigma-adaptin protein complex 4 [Trypanosoma cruzi cruzi]PWV01494.1 putative AP-4 complex subunit sigma-1 [Trypanosoma cruzi]RNF13040.1 clathrin assembly sigma-adaptin protein complex 4 [Trypanosoma cruzi]
MGIEFFLVVNKQGQTRLAQYSSFMSIAERTALEGEVVRKCLQRRESDCSFVEHLHYKLIYRRYASIFFIVGIKNKSISSTSANANGGAAAGNSLGGAPVAPLGETGSGTDELLEEGELAIYEFIHLVVETFDKYFENVCELDVMFNVEKAHFILEEMLVNGGIGETNKLLILQPIVLMDKEPRKL